MIPELKRKKQEIPGEECVEILKTEKRGVLSVNGADGYPYGMPMNHFYNEADGCIYFHSGKGEGHRKAALEKNPKASFCVYDGGRQNPGEWETHFRSVIVFGSVEMTEDPEVVREIGRKLSLKFTNDEESIRADIERSGPATLILKLIPEHICGKRVNES